MNAAREFLRQALLCALAPIPPDLGLGADTLRHRVISAGHQVAETEIVTELQYLADKGLVVLVPKALSPENRRWRLTAPGRDLLAELGLV